MEDVNRALVETFEPFVIWDDRLPCIEEPGRDPSLPTLPEDQGVHAGAIKIDPSLRPEVAQSLLVEHGVEGALWPKPPLAWIEAVRDSDDAQESWHYERSLPLPRGFGSDGAMDGRPGAR